MATQQYTVTQYPVDAILHWIQTGEIAIPEIQRPFVWKATQVRNLLDSLLKGYPIGYLIAWKNPTVKLKDGTLSAGKRILIDGQQRITALMGALLGYEIVSKTYRPQRIRVAFHPLEHRFEVSNSFIARDGAWIPDIAVIFDPQTTVIDVVNDYCKRNPEIGQNDIFRSLDSLSKIKNNPVGLIELDAQLSIETVTEIFIRVNSAGVTLGQADFAMSKIAANDAHDGSTLRKSIDYFCHLAQTPAAFSVLAKNDKAFAKTEFFANMSWLKDENDDLYDPDYKDMLRVIVGAEFRRGRLDELVALLSGRNFTTRDYDDEIIEATFDRMRAGVMRYINKNHFQSFLMILRSAGFVDSSMITSKNAVNVAYMLYLILRDQSIPNATIEREVRRWFVMSVLTGRYSGSFETTIDTDAGAFTNIGIQTLAEQTYSGLLSESFWTVVLPQELEKTSVSSPFWQVFRASQAKMSDHGFLSRDITVRDLIEIKSDVHHLFPKDFLKKAGLGKEQYNQIANYAITQSEININIGNQAPKVYFGQLIEQCNGGPKRYGNITDLDELWANLAMNCIPKRIAEMTVEDYPAFLAERRQLMAQKIRTYFEAL